MQIATNITKHLYGSDILIVDRMLYHVLKYETQQGGLNLTHRQDKDFIQVSIIWHQDKFGISCKFFKWFILFNFKMHCYNNFIFSFLLDLLLIYIFHVENTPFVLYSLYKCRIVFYKFDCLFILMNFNFYLVKKVNCNISFFQKLDFCFIIKFLFHIFECVRFCIILNYKDLKYLI